MNLRNSNYRLNIEGVPATRLAPVVSATRIAINDPHLPLTMPKVRLLSSSVEVRAAAGMLYRISATWRYFQHDAQGRAVLCWLEFRHRDDRIVIVDAFMHSGQIGKRTIMRIVEMRFRSRGASLFDATVLLHGIAPASLLAGAARHGSAAPPASAS